MERRRMHLTTRLLVYFAAVLSVPLVIVSSLTQNLFASFVRELTVEQKRTLVATSLEAIELLREHEEKVSDQILSNPVIQQVLGAPESGTLSQRLLRHRDMEELLLALQRSSRAQGMLVIAQDGETYRSRDNLGALAELPLLRELLGREQFASSRGRNVWLPLDRDAIQVTLEALELNRPFLYMMRKLNTLEPPHTRIGTLVLQYPYTRIVEILQRASRAEGEYTMLVDSNGLLLAHAGGTLGIGERLEGSLAKEHSELLDSAELYRQSADRQGVLLLLRSGRADWTVIHYATHANLLRKSRQVQALTLLTFLLCMLPALGASYFLARSITHPVTALSEAIRRFGAGDLELRIPQDRHDEIGDLQASFNLMAEDMKRLVAKTEEEHTLRRKLELNMLEYQINPHFLYNILDSINWMAQRAGQSEIGTLVAALARFFRLGLSGGRDFMSVGEELEHARNFLIICQMRYRDCFSSSFDVDESLKHCRTLKILLQPVLENAVKHAFEKERTDGNVRVCCHAEQQDIVFTVQDNGRGMNAQRLEEVRRRLERGEQQETYDGGIGLLNIHQRLRLNYGEAYGLEISSEQGRGTTVRIRIPRQT